MADATETTEKPKTHYEVGREIAEHHLNASDREHTMRSEVNGKYGWTPFHQMGFDDALREAVQEGRQRAVPAGDNTAESTALPLESEPDEAAEPEQPDAPAE